MPRNWGAIRASSVASLRRSASIAPQFLSMMTVLTDTSSPELQYSTNTRHFYMCKVASIGFYSPFYIFYMRSFDNFLSKVKFSWLYFSTMHILWDRPSQYDVLLIIHATKVLKSLVYDSWLQVTFVAFMMSKTSYWDGLLTGYLHGCSSSKAA